MVDFFAALFMHPSSTRTHHPFLVILTISFMSADAAEVGNTVVGVEVAADTVVVLEVGDTVVGVKIEPVHEPLGTNVKLLSEVSGNQGGAVGWSLRY